VKIAAATFLSCSNQTLVAITRCSVVEGAPNLVRVEVSLPGTFPELHGNALENTLCSNHHRPTLKPSDQSIIFKNCAYSVELTLTECAVQQQMLIKAAR
jgi:hypothetical protein